MTASTLGHLALRLVLAASLIGLWAMINPEPSYACSCAERSSPSEALERADAVFMGRAVSVSYVEKVRGEQTYIDSVITKFNVTAVWKGPISETAYVDHGGPCGTRFDVGEEYIVYAYNFGRRTGLTTGLCSRTARLSWAMEDLAGLGEGTKPLQARATATPQPAGGPAPQTADTPTPEPTLTPTPQSAGTPAPQPTATPAPQPADTPAPQATDTPAPRPTPPPTPGTTETGGGCSRSTSALDISAVGVLAGLAWFGLRRRRSRSE